VPKVAAYAPHWNPVELDCRHVTLDLSQPAVSESERAGDGSRAGPRLAHVHMADGTKPGLPDEHLVLAGASSHAAELLQRLRSGGYAGVVGT